DFVAQVEVRYTVHGQEYSARVSSQGSSAGFGSNSYPSIRRKVDTYTVGTHYPIRYNPADPYDIRFDLGYTFEFFGAPLILTSLGLICAVVGLGMLIRLHLERRCSTCGQSITKRQRFCPNCAAPLTV